VTSTNPFAALSEENGSSNFLKKLQEDLKEGWSFQGKKKHIVKISSPSQEATQSLIHTPRPNTIPGGKRSQTHSEFHHSFFTSLGIPILANAEHCTARVWPVLTREKNSQKEVLIHSRNQALPNLPIKIRITGNAEED
jgi:hypothetical protein